MREWLEKKLPFDILTYQMENNRKGCINIVIKMDVKISKKYLILIWKQEKDLKSIEENTQGTAFRKFQ